jgi:hypothetical protein
MEEAYLIVSINEYREIRFVWSTQSNQDYLKRSLWVPVRSRRRVSFSAV